MIRMTSRRKTLPSRRFRFFLPALEVSHALLQPLGEGVCVARRSVKREFIRSETSRGICP